MKIIEQAEAKASLADYTESIAQEPVIVTVNGKPVAALVAIENADLETVSLSTNPPFSLSWNARAHVIAPRADSPAKKCDAVSD